MSSVGFASPYDSMWASTLEAMDGQLISDSLVYGTTRRARDRLQGSEGTFSLCSFFYVDALAGLADWRTRLAFEEMLTYANFVGPYSEEITLSGVQIGNFPQTLTHLAPRGRRDPARRGPRSGSLR
jgi:GH15 family glucan-1,4-alpha-glucosidase